VPFTGKRGSREEDSDRLSRKSPGNLGSEPGGKQEPDSKDSRDQGLQPRLERNDVEWKQDKRLGQPED